MLSPDDSVVVWVGCSETIAAGHGATLLQCRQVFASLLSLSDSIAFSSRIPAAVAQQLVFVQDAALIQLCAACTCNQPIAVSAKPAGQAV